MLGRVDLPQFLDADAVGLRILAFVQLETADQLAAEMAARAFGEHGVLRLQRHAAFECRTDAAVLFDAHVAGGHADHRAVVAVQHFGGGKAGEDRHFQRFRLLRQPAGDLAQADDVVAFVVEALGQQRVWGGACAGLAEEQELVAGDLLLQRCAALGPVREQFGQRARVHHRTGQHVRAGLGTLLQHTDRQFTTGFDRALAQTDRGGQAGRAGTDDDHVEFHDFTRGQGVGFSTHRLHDSWVVPASGPPAVAWESRVQPRAKRLFECCQGTGLRVIELDRRCSHRDCCNAAYVASVAANLCWRPRKHQRRPRSASTGTPNPPG
ncbi:hypothetical protein D3C81_770130 [compost metagenome]